MAKISGLPPQGIIDAYRGKLDFYQWCNLNIVRSWPRWNYKVRSPLVQAAQIPFSYINSVASQVDPEVRLLYQDLASSSGLTWKDYLTRFYINGGINFKTHHTGAIPSNDWGETMIIEILPTEIHLVTFGPTNVNIDWTEIDLTAHISAYATKVLIRAFFQKTNTSAGTQQELLFRENDGLQALAACRAWTATDTTFISQNDITVPMDDDHKIEYKVVVGGALQGVFGYIYLVGYVEEY